MRWKRSAYRSWYRGRWIDPWRLPGRPFREFSSNLQVRANENSSLLRRSRYADPRLFRERAKADDFYRRQAHPLAPHELLQPIWAQGFHLVSGLQSQRHKGILPQLPASHIRRLRGLWVREQRRNPG